LTQNDEDTDYDSENSDNEKIDENKEQYGTIEDINRK